MHSRSHCYLIVINAFLQLSSMFLSNLVRWYMIHFFLHEIITTIISAEEIFFLSLYINDHLTFKKSENKRWSLFFLLLRRRPRRRQAAKVQNRKEKKMKEKYRQRACNGCPIHCFIHIFVRLYFRQTHIHINNCLPMANNTKGKDQFLR